MVAGRLLSCALLFCFLCNGLVDFLCSQAGVVHFPKSRVLLHSDIRAMMLLFSQRKQQFMGLIPNDQHRFIGGIKQGLKNTKVVIIFIFY